MWNLSDGFVQFLSKWRDLCRFYKTVTYGTKYFCSPFLFLPESPVVAFGLFDYYEFLICLGRSQWPRAARLLRLWVWILPGAWMFVCCECCVLSGRGLCDELITRPEESYKLHCVVVCDLETSWMRRPCPTGGLLCQKIILNKAVTVGVSCLSLFCFNAYQLQNLC